MLRVIDHTDSDYAGQVAALRKRRGGSAHYTNGSLTYSADILAHHVPTWAAALDPGMDVTLTTAPLLTGRDVRGDLAICYLHNYYPLRTGATFAQVDPMAEWLAPRFGRVLFVTYSAALAVLLRARGMDALHMPMAVDAAAVRSAASVGPRHERRAIAYGNLYGHKAETFAAVRDALTSRGWAVDVISFGLKDGRPIAQREAWAEVSRYPVALACGRSGWESLALGCRVLIVGPYDFGGTIGTRADHDAQAAANLDGNVITGDRDPGVALEIATTAPHHGTQDVRGAAGDDVRGRIGEWCRGA